jgi:hypothetical protein
VRRFTSGTMQSSERQLRSKTTDSDSSIKIHRLWCSVSPTLPIDCSDSFQISVSTPGVVTRHHHPAPTSHNPLATSVPAHLHNAKLPSSANLQSPPVPYRSQTFRYQHLRSAHIIITMTPNQPRASHLGPLRQPNATNANHYE